LQDLETNQIGQGHNSLFTTRVPHVRWVQLLSPNGIYLKWYVVNELRVHGIHVLGNFFMAYT
jgi:hypothetical protein